MPYNLNSSEIKMTLPLRTSELKWWLSGSDVNVLDIVNASDSKTRFIVFYTGEDKLSIISEDIDD